MLRNLIIGFATLAITFCTSFAAFACSCDYAGEFEEFSKGRVVIRGEIVGYGPKLDHGKTLYSTMQVNVSEVIKGTYNHSTIEFMGDPGHLCLTYVDSRRYSIGSEHLFILFSDDQNQGLAGCGEVSVSVKYGRVRGISLNSVDYDKFIEKLSD